MNGEIIDAAKEKAAETGLSLSSFISRLLLEQINLKSNKKTRKKYPGIVGELAGILDINHPRIKNDDYAQYLLNKHS